MEKKPRSREAPFFIKSVNRIEDYATRTRKLRDFSAKGNKAKAEKKAPVPEVQAEKPATIGTVRSAEEVQTERRHREVLKRLKSEYQIDERRDIVEDGELIPNPRFGEHLDS